MRAAAQRWLFRPAAGPVARGAAGLVARLPRRPIAAPAPPVRTVVVGGLAIGGAGRTPAVALLAGRARARGLRVAVVGHGYRGDARGVRRVDADDAELFGDEAVELRRALPEVPIWIGPRALALSAASIEAELVLVDGGLFDRTCPRTQSLALVDATAPRAVLPAGPLRAPLGRLAEADLVWLHRVDEPGARPLPTAAVRSRVRAVALGWAGRRRRPRRLRGRRVVPACGIARPESFRHVLRALGARLEPGFEVADHAPLPLGALVEAARSALVVTTAKDRARLPADLPVAVLHVETEVMSGGAHLDRVVFG